MKEYLLTTNDLTKRYGHQKAVDRVSVHIGKGAVYGLIGRNGAGKTTFLRMIAGLAKPTGGEISLFGHTGKELENIRTRVGCLIEGPGLYPGMTALENLRTKCILLGIHKKGYEEELLRLVGLSHTGKKKTGRFSLGMRQRLGIALALVGEPDTGDQPGGSDGALQRADRNFHGASGAGDPGAGPHGLYVLSDGG